jgi:predicted NBD/HSP70 family sugar kinase
MRQRWPKRSGARVGAIETFFYASVGTGIGTGIILDGRIFHGKTGAAAEGGQPGIDCNGPVCNCGKRGCIETLAAGPASARRALPAPPLSVSEQERKH